MVFEKMRKNENGSFYLINYAKIKLENYFAYRVCTEARCKARKQRYFILFRLKAFYLYFLSDPHGMFQTINMIWNFLRLFQNYYQTHCLKWVKNEQLQRQKTHLGKCDT